MCWQILTVECHIFTFLFVFAGIWVLVGESDIDSKILVSWQVIPTNSRTTWL